MIKRKYLKSKSLNKSPESKSRNDTKVKLDNPMTYISDNLTRESTREDLGKTQETTKTLNEEIHKFKIQNNLL